MKIELAYPWTDDKGKTHAPDSVVSVPEDLGRRLIFEGFARPVTPQNKE